MGETATEETPNAYSVWDSINNWTGHGMEVLSAVGKASGEKVASAVPLIGMATDLWGTGAGIYEMYNGYQDDGLHSDDFYTGAGKTVNNGLGFALQGAAAAVPLLAMGVSGLAGLVGGPGGALLAGAATTVLGTEAVAALETANGVWNVAQAGVDVAGLGAELMLGEDAGFDADGMMGSMIRGTVGDESIGWSAGAAMSNAMGGEIGADIVGGIAGTAINGALLPVNIADTAIGGVVNWFGDAADSDNEDTDYWQNFKDSVNPFVGMY